MKEAIKLSKVPEYDSSGHTVTTSNPSRSGSESILDVIATAAGGEARYMRLVKEGSFA